jgi:surfactin synthase thioesterase subunit
MRRLKSLSKAQISSNRLCVMVSAPMVTCEANGAGTSDCAATSRINERPANEYSDRLLADRLRSALVRVPALIAILSLMSIYLPILRNERRLS